MEVRVLRDDLQHTPVDDDGVIRSTTCSYGVAEPFKGDSVELTEKEASLQDPISGSGPASLLLRLLCFFFAPLAFHDGSQKADRSNAT